MPGTSKDPNRWALSNWTGGPVTLFQALGIRKGTVQYPKLEPSLAAQAAANAGTAPKSSGGAAKAPANDSEKAFFTAVLEAIGAPASQANLDSMYSWALREEPTWPPPAAYNPLNTTQNMPGATVLPGVSVPIKQYASAQQGVQATALTLQNGYPGIVAALKSGKGLCGQSQLAREFLTWSGNGYSSVCS